MRPPPPPQAMPAPALLRRLPLAFALLLAASCGGSDEPTGPDPDVVAAVSVSPSSATVDVDETVQLSATATNSQGGTVSASVSWSSSATGVATVSSSGLVTGVGSGSATITATAGGRSGAAAVTVVDPSPPAAPSGLTASPASHTEVELSWTDGSDNESGFEIERETADGSAAQKTAGDGAEGAAAAAGFESVGSVGAGVTTFTDTGLEPATEYRWRVRATNGNGDSDFTEPAEATTFAALVLETESLPGAVLDQAYEATLAAAGGAGSGTYAWALVSGAFPEGLSLSEEGVVSGTPTEIGTFTVEVSVSSGGQTASRSLELTVTEELLPPQVVTVALPDASVGVAYSQPLEATGGDGTYSWAVVSGAFPQGLELAADGTVSGTPTVDGQATVTVEVTSAELTGSGEVSITVVAKPLEVTTTTLEDGQVGSGYQVTLTAEGGVPPVTWSLLSGSLPAGIELADDGTLSGTPTTAGTSTFTVKAAGSDGQEATADLTLAVYPGPVTIVTDDLDGGQVGTAYSLALQATGGNGVDYSWTVSGGAAPPGLTLSPSGALSGTPSSEGTFEFQVRATSGEMSDSRVMILTTVPQPRAGYQVDLVYLTQVSDAVRAVFESSQSRWSELITADEVDEVGGVPRCGSFHPATQATVDDVVIYVSVEEIDGAGGTLGQAAPCYVRDDGSLKALTGAMVFDQADVNNLLNNDLLSLVILHEMGHVLGLGVTWQSLGLRSGDCLVDPIFTGAGAIQAFNEADGTLYSGEPVPLEDEGSLNDGSNCSHWRESVLGPELMTPFLNGGSSNPLSAITVRSLEDMGYTVDASRADAYKLPKPVPAGVAPLGGGAWLGNDVLNIPLLVVGPDGRPVRVGGRR